MLPLVLFAQATRKSRGSLRAPRYALSRQTNRPTIFLGRDIVLGSCDILMLK